MSDAARELLQGDEEMQAVHSAKSVTAMLRAARDKIAAGKQDGKVVASKNANEVSFVAIHRLVCFLLIWARDLILFL